MTTLQIIDVQNKIGATPDGFWGPKSIAACQKYLRSLMPNPNTWPSQDQKSLTNFYGEAGDEGKLQNINVRGLNILYDGSAVSTIRVHHKCAQSLLRILTEISKSPHRRVLQEYAGVYNNRPMRNGNLPSLHARGAAIDLMPSSNRNSQSWPTSANMPLEVMEIFAKEGWLPAGAFWSRDAMHFQATK